MNWLIFLRNCGFGACLADDMGLGKTIQMIAYFAYLKEQGQQTPSLIIAPSRQAGREGLEFALPVPEDGSRRNDKRRRLLSLFF